MTNDDDVLAPFRAQLAKQRQDRERAQERQDVTDFDVGAWVKDLRSGSDIGGPQRIVQRAARRATPLGGMESLLTTQTGRARGPMDFVPLGDMAGMMSDLEQLDTVARAMNDGTATREQEFFLENWVDRQMRPRTFWAVPGEIAAHAPSFVVEALLTGGAGAAARKTIFRKAAQEALERESIREAAGRLLEQRLVLSGGSMSSVNDLLKFKAGSMARGGGRILATGTERAALGETMRAPFGATRSEAKAKELMFANEFDISVGDAGRLHVDLVKNAPDFMDALRAGMAETWLEWVTESAGEEFAKLPLLNKIEALQSYAAKKIGFARTKELMARGMWAGSAFELLEEEFGMISREAIAASGLAPEMIEEEWSEAWKTDFKDHLQMYVGLLAVGGGQAIVGAGVEAGVDALSKKPEFELVIDDETGDAVLMPKSPVPPKPGRPVVRPEVTKEEADVTREEQREIAPRSPEEVREALKTTFAKKVEREQDVATKAARAASSEELTKQELDAIADRFRAQRAKGEAAIDNLDFVDEQQVSDRQRSILEEARERGIDAHFVDRLEDWGPKAVSVGEGVVVLSTQLEQDGTGPNTLEAYFWHEALHDALRKRPEDAKAFFQYLRRYAPQEMARFEQEYKARLAQMGLTLKPDELEEEGAALLTQHLVPLIQELQQNRDAVRELVKAPNILRRVLDGLIRLINKAGLKVDTSVSARLRPLLDSVEGKKLSPQQLEERAIAAEEVFRLITQTAASEGRGMLAPSQVPTVEKPGTRRTGRRRADTAQTPYTPEATGETRTERRARQQAERRAERKRAQEARRAEQRQKAIEQGWYGGDTGVVKDSDSVPTPLRGKQVTVTDATGPVGEQRLKISYDSGRRSESGAPIETQRTVPAAWVTRTERAEQPGAVTPEAQEPATAERRAARTLRDMDEGVVRFAPAPLEELERTPYGHQARFRVGENHYKVKAYAPTVGPGAQEWDVTFTRDLGGGQWTMDALGDEPQPKRVFDTVIAFMRKLVEEKGPITFTYEISDDSESRARLYAALMRRAKRLGFETLDIGGYKWAVTLDNRDLSDTHVRFAIGPEDDVSLSFEEAMAELERFSPEAQMSVYEEQAKRLGAPLERMLDEMRSMELDVDERGRLLSPTGAPSKLTEYQWRLVRTSAFRGWFGDWLDPGADASVVRDKATGEPLVVYHGTPHLYDGLPKASKVNRDNQLGLHAGTIAQAEFFANQPGLKGYTAIGPQQPGVGGRIYPLFLNIRDPLYLPDLGSWDHGDIASGLHALYNTGWEAADDMAWEVQAGKRHDGAVYHNFVEGTTLETLPEEADLTRSLGVMRAVKKAVAGTQPGTVAWGSKDFLWRVANNFISERKSSPYWEPWQSLVWREGHERRLPPQLSFIATRDDQIASAAGGLAEYLDSHESLPDVNYALPPARMVRARLHQKLSVDDYGPQTPLAKLWMNSVRRFADRNTYVNRFVQYAKAVGANVNDASDVIGWIERMPGIIDRQARRVEEKFVEPLKKRIAESGMTLEEIGRWLYARHAPERNQWFVDKQAEYEKNKAEVARLNKKVKAIKQGTPEQIGALLQQRDRAKEATEKWLRFARNKKFDLDAQAGSGMSNAKAADILAKHKDNKALQEIGELADQVGRLSLRLRLQSGLNSQEQYDELVNRWDHYVPLKDDQQNHQLRFASSRRFGASGKEFQAARGRHSEALGDPLAYLLSQVFDSIERSQRNRVGQAFGRLLRENAGILAEKGTLRELREDETHDPQLSQDTFTFKENGKEVVATVDADLARALNQLNIEKVPEFVRRFVVPITRYLSATATSWNPDFILPNFARDLGTAAINISAEDIPGIRRKIIGAAFSGRPQAAMWRSVKGVEPRQVSDPEARAWLEYAIRMEKNGGRTGWYYRKSLLDIQNDLIKSIEKPSTGGFRRLIQGLDDVNVMVENATRLATFRALVEAGYTDKQAAHVAKNLTVNFNRSGEAGPFINSLWMFFNASIGGMLQMGRAMATPGPGRARVWKALGVMVALGAMQELFNRLQGDDDEGKPLIDSISDWEQDTNYILLTPEGIPELKFPLPYVANAFHKMGRSLVKVAFFGASPIDEAVDIAKIAAESTNPMGSSPTPVHFLFPTLADPLADVWTNTKFHGGPLYPEDRGFGPGTADAYQSFKGTAAPFKWAAEAINSFTGGDKVKPGFVDPHPDTLEHLFEFAGGGTYRFGARVLNALSGEASGVSEIPIIRRFLAEAPEYQLRIDFWDAIEDIEEVAERVRVYTEDPEVKDPAYVRQLRKNYGAVLSMKDSASAAKKQLKKLNERLESATSEDARSRAETQIERHYKQFLRRYYKAHGATE